MRPNNACCRLEEHRARGGKTKTRQDKSLFGCGQSLASFAACGLATARQQLRPNALPARVLEHRREILFTPLHGLQPPPKCDTAMGQECAEPFPCDPRAVTAPRCDALNSHGNDMLDPMIIIGPYKLMLGVVDQCWWQGPDYPNGTSTWDTHGSWINCTTATKKACLFNASRATSSPFLSLPLLLGSLFAPVQTRDAERCGG